MQRHKVITLTFLTLGVLMVLGLSAFAGPQQEREGPRGRGRVEQPGQMLERWSAALNLTDDQKAQIKPILEEQAKQIGALRSDESLSREQRMAKMKEIHEATQKQLKPILTAEQQKKLEEMQEKGRGQRTGPKEERKDTKEPGN